MAWKKIGTYSFAAFFLVALDFFLKAYVYGHFANSNSLWIAYPYGGIGVFKDWYGIDFALVHVANKGAAWGLFSSLQDYLLYARVALIGGLVCYLLFVAASAYRKWSLLIVTAGAIGNVIDYFLYGHVVDMFYFNFWGYSYPVFNVADSLIFLGIALLVLERAKEKWRLRKRTS